MKIFKALSRVALLSIFAVMFAIRVSASGDETDINPVGHFYGVGWENDGIHWSVEVLLTEISGQVAYPSLECSGNWTLVENAGNRRHFIETISERPDMCFETGDIMIDPLSDGRLLYSWNEPGAKTGARAILLPVTDTRKSYMELLLITLNGISFDYLLPEFTE